MTDRREFMKSAALAAAAVAIGLTPEQAKETVPYERMPLGLVDLVNDPARWSGNGEFWTEFRTWDRTVHDVEILHGPDGGEELRFVPVRKDLF